MKIGPFSTNDLWTVIPELQCLDGTVYLQYTCVMTEDQQYYKYLNLCIIVSLAILICFVFMIFIRWIIIQSKIRQLEWDIATITLSDYSVEFPISKESYLNWYENLYKAPDGDSGKQVAPSYSLKKFLIKQIEASLNDDLIGENSDEETLNHKGFKIADIQFSFDNGDLIH